MLGLGPATPAANSFLAASSCTCCVHQPSQLSGDASPLTSTKSRRVCVDRQGFESSEHEMALLGGSNFQDPVSLLAGSVEVEVNFLFPLQVNNNSTATIMIKSQTPTPHTLPCAGYR